MTIALEEAGGVHARQEIEFTISVIAAPGMQDSALAQQATKQLRAWHGLKQAHHGNGNGALLENRSNTLRRALHASPADADRPWQIF
jgi:hypothetical protein